MSKRKKNDSFYRTSNKKNGNERSGYIKQSFTGTMDINSSGNGYFICEQLERDVFIPLKKLSTAQHKDEVEVTVYIKKGKKRLEGEVSKIIKRYKSSLTGVICFEAKNCLVIPVDRHIINKIKVNVGNFKDVKDGDKVVININKWNQDGKLHEGVIVDVLGTSGEHNTEIKGILVEHGLPYHFPKKVEAFVKTLDLEINDGEVRKRRDMRNILTFTIDPKDAKDFDDALSFEVLANGNFEIGIHIADVSHYVKEGSILDDEAYSRATSIYLVDRVIPMLPEILSNGVCSLRPKEDKYTFSAVFEIDKNAIIINQWFGRTVINSNERFAYEEAQHIIEEKNGNIPKYISLTGKAYKADTSIFDAVLQLNNLAKIMRSKRMNLGAISFDKVEIKFKLDENSDPIGVIFKKGKDANHLVEEFMLLANKNVAEFIGKEKKKTFIYRIHDEPDIEKLNALKSIASKFGHIFNLTNKKKISSSLNHLLKDVKGNKEQNLVDTLAIRTMSKAKYSMKNIGHYGLAFDYYSHFTSPIRRYSDIIAHRLLQYYLDNNPAVNEDIYEEKCNHCSDMESVAVNAERDSIKYMQIRFLELQEKTSYDGIISGVTERSIYVEISENGCEGMIRFQDMEDDMYFFNAKDYAVVGKKTKKIYTLGDKVSVSIKSLNLEKRHINLWLNN